MFYLTGVVAGVVRIGIIFIIIPQIRTGERGVKFFCTTCRFIITIDSVVATVLVLL